MSRVKMLKPIGRKHYVIILDDLEFAFHRDDLDRIRLLHNQGFYIHEIATHLKRDEYEILLAILHLHRQGEIKRKIRIV